MARREKAAVRMRGWQAVSTGVMDVIPFISSWPTLASVRGLQSRRSEVTVVVNVTLEGGRARALALALVPVPHIYPSRS